jgi:hypothetical protein
VSGLDTDPRRYSQLHYCAPRHDDSAVRHRDRCLAGDGQVTFGDTVVKQGAKKIRRLYNDRILAGFAGSAADSFALFSRFESKLEQYRGNLERSAVELAKDWRTDRILRRLGHADRPDRRRHFLSETAIHRASGIVATDPEGCSLRALLAKPIPPARSRRSVAIAAASVYTLEHRRRAEKIHLPETTQTSIAPPRQIVVS